VADLQRRTAERRLIRAAYLVTLSALAFAAAPIPLRGQAPAADTAAGAHRGVGALVDLDLRLARLAGRTGLLAGGRLLVEFPSRWRLGGGAHVVLERVGDSPGQIGPERSLALGYAGLVAEWSPWREDVSLTLLAGAGVATLRDRVLGTRVDAEVVAVVEPGVSAALVRLGRAQLLASAGYRLVFNVGDLEALSSSDLRSAFFSVSVRLGPL